MDEVRQKSVSELVVVYCLLNTSANHRSSSWRFLGNTSSALVKPAKEDNAERCEQRHCSIASQIIKASAPDQTECCLFFNSLVTRNIEVRNLSTVREVIGRWTNMRRQCCLDGIERDSSINSQEKNCDVVGVLT